MTSTIPKRILIIKFWAVGDILMATPMLNAIRTKDPGAYIAWMVDIQNQELLRDHPLIDELIVVDTGSWRRLLRRANLPAWIRRTRELNDMVKSYTFDAIINCQTERWWTYFLCPAPIRVGVFALPILPNTKRLYTHSIPKPRLSGLHNTAQFLQATSILGFPPASLQMSIGQPAEEAMFIEGFTRDHSLSKDRPVVVLAPFSTEKNRSIDIEAIAGISDWLTEDLKAQIVFSCADKDRHSIGKVEKLTKHASFIVPQRTNLREYIALIRSADLVICADSGPMHIAAAVGVPWVALFGPTPVDERAPLTGSGRALYKPIPCGPCDLPTCTNKVFQQCMKLIELSDVKKAILELLGTG
jgi:ADP-heptose:LPS heptosyltransferase